MMKPTNPKKEGAAARAFAIVAPRPMLIVGATGGKKGGRRIGGPTKSRP